MRQKYKKTSTDVLERERGLGNEKLISLGVFYSKEGNACNKFFLLEMSFVFVFVVLEITFPLISNFFLSIV